MGKTWHLEQLSSCTQRLKVFCHFACQVSLSFHLPSSKYCRSFSSLCKENCWSALRGAKFQSHPQGMTHNPKEKAMVEEIGEREATVASLTLGSQIVSLVINLSNDDADDQIFQAFHRLSSWHRRCSQHLNFRHLTSRLFDLHLEIMYCSFYSFVTKGHLIDSVGWNKTNRSDTTTTEILLGTSRGE